MKPGEKTGSTGKSQPTTAVPLVCPDPKVSSGEKPRFGSPSAAIWTKYIDSRMKQFGTR